MPYRTARPGISLSEALLVIAILALLLALLLPAIQRVREAANCMACANNLRAIGSAFADMTAGNQPYPMGQRRRLRPARVGLSISTQPPLLSRPRAKSRI